MPVDLRDRPARLRGHHLLCVLTYVGRGYSDDFVANLDAVAVALSRNGRIEIVDGPDDVCRPVMNTPDSHCFDSNARDRDSAALADIGHLLGRPLSPGDSLTLDADSVDRLRAAFATDAVRSACQACQWYDICTAVAESGFSAARLRRE